MNSSMNDENISKFLDEWYSIDIQNMVSILKISLTKDILSCLSKEHKSKENFLLGYRNSVRIFWSIKKTFWFCLWCLKWIVAFSKHKNEKVLLVAIGSNLNNIDVYLEQLSVTTKKNNNYIIILLNLIESYKHLRNPQFYYFPRFFYTKNYNEYKVKIKKYTSEIINSVKILSEKNNIQISLNAAHLVKPIKSLILDYSGFSYLVNKLISPNRIVGLIQDYDYTYNKFVYYKIASQSGIKTCVLDSSLPIYQHLYKKTFSEYHLVWGEYKKEFILKSNLIDPSKIIVIGKPRKLESSLAPFTKSSKFWIYITQSYQDPSMFISGRDYTSFIKNVRRLSDFQKKNYPNDKFVLKIHPADKLTNHTLANYKSTVSILKLVNKARIIFIEDSTLAVELFAYNYPLVYVLDKFKNDNIGLVNKGLMTGINVTGEIDKTIKGVFEKKEMHNKKEREEVINYYLGNFDKNNFRDAVEKILFNDEH
jgi:hypothetical protein